MTMWSTKTNLIPSLLLYVSGLLLLWEWLRPIDELTETGNIYIFLGFLTMALALSFNKMKFLPAALIKMAYILYFLHYFYLDGSFFQLTWLGPFIKDLSGNIGYVIQMDWQSLSFLFRSLLFFILLWLMSYLIHYWFMIRRQVFVFFFMTLVYITVLDTFTPYDATHAIVRTVVIGFAVMGALTFYRLVEKEKLATLTIRSHRWILPLGVFIGVSVALGLSAPKAKPIWPDPVPYIVSYNEESGAGTVSKVGYGTDDRELGGPFVGDNTLVYTTLVENRHYWRVETKDFYTGKGWDVSAKAEAVPFTNDDSIPLSPFSTEGVTLEESTSVVTAINRYPHLIYPLGAKKVDTDNQFSFEIDENREKIYTLENDTPVSLNSYTLTYDVADYSMTALKATKVGTDMTPILTEGFLERYTQLPATLPQRVGDLAVEISVGKDNWYDQARAVEQYFGQNGFTYDQKNVLTPGDEDDYVDQFLFDSKRGYCDNYSTSMVVLLRSLGIPSRWVKGYTEGVYKEVDEESGLRVYEITNNNAHSWVEVFFPGVGWVPFEPTQGFTSPAQFNFDEIAQSTEQQETAEASTTPQVDNPNTLEEEETTVEQTKSWKDRILSVPSFVKKHWEQAVLLILGLAFVGWLSYKLRFKWLPYVLVAFFKWKKKDEDFVHAYLTLLKQLQRYGLTRKEGQTLREYANYVDQFFSTQEMGKLTARYEQYVYKGELVKGSWDESKELWENLIKKTIA